ncbi:MAG: hypothetical protein BWZ02_00631 [Lentisphaerae bacterium ADurb.BinA184]|nr:MAG: hypothetical protein BWZ02_00631 [Lentisphaerae bacterium ADurb.BinA184]
MPHPIRPRASRRRPVFPPLAILGVCLLTAATPAGAAMLGGRPPSGFEQTFGLSPDQKARDYTAQLIESSAPANVFWPGDEAVFTFQFINLTDAPLAAEGRIEILTYITRTGNDVFATSMERTGEAGTVPVTVSLAAKGFNNVRVKVPLPERFGAYALVVDLPGHGRQFGAGCVRTPAATPGRVQYPSYAMDIRGGSVPQDAALFQRLGIRGARMECGYFPTTSREFYQRFAALAEQAALMRDHDITLMLTLGGGGPQPLGRWRPHLDADNRMLETKFDMAWLPESDEDYQQWVSILAGTFGWPRGPVNAIELWNEPWEGLSISGWGADCLRYREIYTRMAQGIEEARKDFGVKVLIGGACSSMNTDDKLFCDGTDDFLKWLDFTSIHYQPMCAAPALIKSWAGRKSPYGPVRVWDTESWVANTEDRVAGVIASMRAQGQSRTAGVFHDSVSDLQRVRVRTASGTADLRILQTWAPAAAIAAVQKFIGERPFRQLVFANGLPWVFQFDGLPGAGGKPDPDDITLVVVGDLGGIYERDRTHFRQVRGLRQIEPAEQARIAGLERQLAELGTEPATAEARKALTVELREARVLSHASLALDAADGAAVLYDFYGNPLPAADGRITVPLNGLGYFLRPSGAPGSGEKLLAAVRAADVRGYEPLAIEARDLTGRVETQPVLRLSLTNILNRPVTGSLDLKLAGLQLDTPRQTLTLAPGETRELSVKVTGGAARPDNTYPLSLVFDAGADGRALHQEDLHVNVVARRTLTVDGDLTDWKDVLPQPVTGTGTGGPSLTEKAWLPFLKFDETTTGGVATGYLAYDEQYFYFAAKIADATPYDGSFRFETRDPDQDFYPEKVIAVTRDPKTKDITKTEELTWPAGVRRYTYRQRPPLPSGLKTDNVQIGFNVVAAADKDWLPNPPGTMPRFMAYKCTDYEYALNPVADRHGGGTEIWRLAAPGTPRKHFYPRQPKAPVDGGPVKEGKLVLLREGTTRVVELALPWSEIPEVRKRLDAGQPIKFTFRVNDNDPKAASYELAGGRSVSQINTYALHDYWMASWANEVEFAFEK